MPDRESMRQSGAIQVSEAGSESTVGRGGMRRHWPVLALLLGLCWAGGAMAQEGYPHAEQVHRQVAARDDYMLALGHIRRMGALWQPSESLRLSGEDRKSTRLNSSHVAISYAVLCLQQEPR